MTSNLKDRVGITEVGALSMWVRSVVGKHFNVKFEHGAETAYVDERGNMVIPTPNSNMTIRDCVRLRGFALHETSHPMYQPDIFKIMRKYPTKKGSPLGGIYNALLDVHAETRRYIEWPGDGKALSEFGAVVGHDVYERLRKLIKDPSNDIPPNFAKMASVMLACRNAEATWNVGMLVGFDRLVKEIYTQDIRDKSVELEAKFNLTRKLVTDAEITTEYDIWELSKQIYEWLWDKDPEQEIGGSGDGEGKPKPEDGDPKDKDGDGEGKGKPKPEFGEGEDGDEAEPLTEKIPLEALFHSDHYETMAGGGIGVGFDYAGYKKCAEYTPIDPATFKVIDYSTVK